MLYIYIIYIYIYIMGAARRGLGIFHRLFGLTTESFLAETRLTDWRDGAVRCGTVRYIYI
jgi:hypothetical protein